jgi:hypothetical protein
LRFQCLLLLDEMTAIGKIHIIARAVAYMAGYNLRLLSVVQSIAQLESVYGRADARTFLTNHAMQILYAPREQKDANDYSEMLGTFTDHSRSVSRPSAIFGGRGGSSESMSEQRRPLLLPQELKELGRDKEIIVLENTKPILADRICYWRDPVFASRVSTAPSVPAMNLARFSAQAERRRARGWVQTRSIRKARDCSICRPSIWKCCRRGIHAICHNGFLTSARTRSQPMSNGISCCWASRRSASRAQRVGCPWRILMWRNWCRQTQRARGVGLCRSPGPTCRTDPGSPAMSTPHVDETTRVRAALAVIPADDYGTWVDMAFASSTAWAMPASRSGTNGAARPATTTSGRRARPGVRQGSPAARRSHLSSGSRESTDFDLKRGRTIPTG